MSGQSFQKQVVFLVDVNREQIDENKQNSQEFVNTVCLSAFRLLSYFEDVGNSIVKSKPKNRQRNHLKWGFKFYNSRYHQSRIKQYSLKDFKLRYFEEFENEIERKFETREQNTGQKQCGSDCLRKTLIELIHDFQWQTPDITSPVKCRRGSKVKPVVENADLNKNLVFLFSFCPKSAGDLRQFSGKKVIDSGVFLDSFMPQSLRKEFSICNLQLFWVDMTMCFESSITDLDLMSIRLAEDALEQLGGRLLQIESLVQLCHLATANSWSVDVWLGSDCQLGSEVREADLLPKTRALNLNLTQMFGEVRPSNSKQSDQQKIPTSILPFSSVIECLLSRKNLLRTSGNPKLPTQELNAVVDFMNGNKIYFKLQNSSKECRDDSTQSDGSLFHISLGESSNIGLCLEGDDVMTIEKGKSMASLSADDGIVHFCLCGVISDDISLNFSFGTGDVFVCTSDVSASSADFHKLLLQLTAKKKSLVLQVKGNPCLFLMKSLTAVSATLCSLTLGRTLRIEKVLQQEQKGSQFIESSSCEKTTSDTGEPSWRKLLSKLHKEKFPVISHCTVDDRQTNGVVCFDPRTVDKAYLPGCQPSLVSLVDKLNERISQLDFLTEGEVKALRQLRQAYRYEVHPPRPWDNARKSFTATDPSKTTVIIPEQVPEVDVDKSKLTKQDSKKGRSSVTTRGEMMVTRSRQTVKDVKCEFDDKSVVDTKQAPKPSVSSINIDFQDESELEAYLKDLYEKTLDTDGNLAVCAQTIVMVSLHYMKEKMKESPEETCDKFLRPAIIIPAARLRDKYQAADDNTKLQKIKEYQLQIILRLECQSIQLEGDTSLSEADGKLDEVVTMLRTLSFITEPAVLSAFMKDTLVEHFVDTIPHTLGSIYDELMQPLPPALESILSPNHSADQSVFSQSLLSCDSTGPASNAPDISASQPASNKSDVLLNRSKHNTRKRSLVHHPSLAEVGSKRQIFVHVDTKAASKKRKLSSRNSTQSQAKKKQKVKGSAEKVCRNLFENDRKKLERHQSVTIMEGASQKSRHRKKALHSLKSPRGLKSPFKSPPFQFKNVIETPAHKQKTQNIFSKIEKERHRSKSVTNIHIVEESPVKLVAEKYSPVQNKRAMALLRRSFYSAGPTNRSRNLTKSFQLAERIAGRSSTTASRLSLGSFLQDTSSEFKSPDKSNSSFMFCQLMGSPTPTKGTPCKTSITPAKVIMDSPCMNTRSRSPGCFDGTPRKGALGIVISSPSMNTRSRSPGFAVSFQQALFKDSPSLKKKSLDEMSESGNSKTMTTNKQTPLKSDMINICESPSQNTRSKLTSTPSSTRRSVRAKMFLFRSPEQNTAPSSIKTDSISRSKCLNLTSFEEKTKNIDGNCKNKDGHAPVNLRLLEKNHGAGGIHNVHSDNNSQIHVFEQPNKTPSPNRPSNLQYSLETTSPEREKTPSPKPKLPAIKTPKSLNHWPRKKRACADSPNVKGGSSLTQQRGTDNLKESDFEENEVSFKITNKEQQNILKDHPLCVSPVCKKIQQHVSPSMKLTPRRQICVDDDNDKISPLLLMASPNVKKRNLILSPDKETVFSPSKRRRISNTNAISGHQPQNLPVSYSLHRRILSQKVPSMTSSQTSLGFDTDMILSQDGVKVSNSQTSMTSISQSSLESLEYFSLSNEEVFLCEKSKPAVDQVRSNSPLLGSKSRFRSPVSTSANEKNLSPRLGSDASNSETSKTSSPFLSSSLVDAPSKLSPSGRKYSPNVSAKSLMHLMNSPLMSGPMEDLTSPKIDKDSLNTRRHKTRGRSKRSLNLQI